MLTKLISRIENYLLGVPLCLFFYLYFFWSDGVQNLSYWQNYTGVPYDVALWVLIGMIVLAFTLCKFLRLRSTLQLNLTIPYVLFTIACTIAIFVICLQSPFIEPQWQNAILPPPVYDTWNWHMHLMSYLYLTLVFSHFVYVVYALMRLVLVPAVERMSFAEMEVQ